MKKNKTMYVVALERDVMYGERDVMYGELEDVEQFIVDQDDAHQSPEKFVVFKVTGAFTPVLDKTLLLVNRK